MGVTAIVYLSAVLEYLTAEVLKDAAKNQKFLEISFQQIRFGTRNYRQLKELFIPEELTKPVEPLAPYINKVLFKVLPLHTISPRAMDHMSSWMTALVERIATMAVYLTHYKKRTLISLRKIEESLPLILPSYLLENANSEGNQAVYDYLIKRQRKNIYS